MGLLILLLVINTGISWWNAYVCGKAWSEARAVGGWIRLVVWCGAAQSAIGFSMLFIFLEVGIGTAIGWLDPSIMKAAVSMWYLAVIVPVLGTGFIIMIHSWIIAWRERDLLSMGSAAWNTFAMAHNAYSSIEGIGSAWKEVRNFVGDVDGDSAKIVVPILLVLIALLGGVLLTAVLIQKYAGTMALPERDRAMARA